MRGRYIKGKYYSGAELRKIKQQLRDDQFEDFLVSGVVAYATGSSVVGALAGGSIAGGLLGDILEGTDDSIF